ncbi:MAG: peptidoglycan DD-metalloendopeptidase family protein [Saprospiraceae bacterium]
MQFKNTFLQLFKLLRERSKFIFDLKFAYVRVFGLGLFILSSAYAGLHSTSLFGASNVDTNQYVDFSKLKYGFSLDTFFQAKTAKIASNESFKDFVEGTGLSAVQIDKINRNCDGIFDVRHFRTGKEYMILTREKGKGADYFCYSPDLFSHLIINLKTLEVSKKDVQFETRVESASGIIESNIWNTMVDNGWSYDITDRLEDALSCSVDFHHTDEGDKFKFIYENRYVNGKPVATGNLLAAYFTDNNKEYYAIWYDDGKVKGFFDQDGRPMKKTFLKSPVRFSHISSGFNLRRLHPILRYVKPHLGTDFAAPTGTPIMAVADGIVEEATRAGGNGIYVKIRHDNKYETQYLHMCRHAKGIKRGVHVMQGQTIGYVGSTGLATGPHVCFRFWKNGSQCNFQKADLPVAKIMDASSLPTYMKYKNEVIANLAKIPYRTAEEIQAAKMNSIAYKQ